MMMMDAYRGDQRRQRSLSRILLVSALTLLSSLRVQGEETEADRRLAYLTDLFAQFSVAPAESDAMPLVPSAEPLLRYSNPVRNSQSDGCTWLWLRGEVPLAATSMSVRGNAKVGAEFASFSTEPLVCLRDGSEFWTPRSGGHLNGLFDEAVSVHTAKSIRLAQMRRLAAAFRVSMSAEAETPQDLRLLSQPIHRYSSKADGIVDGALFSFAEVTDPEALLLIEAVQKSDEGVDSKFWRYSLSRMTSRPLVFHLNDAEVWSVEGYWSNPHTLQDAYIESILGSYPESAGSDTPSPDGQ